MDKKVFLLIVEPNIFYDNNGKQFWTARYDLLCSICEKNPADYFTTKSLSRYCDDCVTILSLNQVFSAQQEVEQQKAKALKTKEAADKRLEEEEAAEKLQAGDELKFMAEMLYESFMDYHRVHNQYLKPEWADAIEGDKDHFYHMADYLVSYGYRLIGDKEQSNGR